MNSSMRFISALMIAGAVSSCTPPPSPVAPQEPNATNPAAVGQAYALFNEAKALAAEGRYSEACPKFEESDRLNHGTGTLFALGDCYEHIDRLASALACFTTAAQEYRRAGNSPFATAAQKRADALEPKVGRLAIHVSSAAAGIAGLQVTRGGKPVTPGTWGSFLPVDAGEHVIMATAPGKTLWQLSKRVEDEKKVEVDVPPLVDAPMSAQRIGAIVLGGVGVAGVALGTAFGIETIVGKSDCRNLICRDQGTLDGLFTSSYVSTIGFAVGGAALVAGSFLWFTAPPTGGAPPVQTGVVIAPGAAFGTVQGAF